MLRTLVVTALVCGAVTPSVPARSWAPSAQAGTATEFPAAALSAKTVAIVNDTHDPKVVDGALTALRSWGQFTVVDDPSVADLTLRFDRSKERSGAATPQKTDADGKPVGEPSYGYSFSSSSQVHLKVFLKDGDATFWTIKTGDSKVKAGMGCVNAFHTAWRSAKAGNV